MTIFPVAPDLLFTLNPAQSINQSINPDQTIAQMWSNGVWWAHSFGTNWFLIYDFL